MSIIDAILNINPNAVVNVSGTDIDNCEIEWLEGTAEISKEDIKTKMAEIAYIKKREKEYPSLQEFAEAYCEKEIGGDNTKCDAYKTAYNKVRSDNPKE